MDLNLAGKVFIVTGGAKGIGAAISKGLAAEKGIVVVAGRNKQDNQSMVDEIVKAGGKAASVAAELAKAEACKEVIDFTVEKYGKIDGLINNAGVNDGVGLEKGNPEKFFESLHKNLSHYYNLAHYALPHLKKNKGQHCECRFKSSSDRTGKHFRLCRIKGRHQCIDERMGR